MFKWKEAKKIVSQNLFTENTGDDVLFSSFPEMRANSFIKRIPSKMIFLENLEILQNIIFT